MHSIIDTHAHLYSPEFSDDIQQVVERAQNVGVQKIILPNIDADSILPMMELTEQFPNFFYPTIGIHPTSINGDYQQQIYACEPWLKSEKMVAIGEISIDLYWDKTFLNEQKETLRIQLQWAKELNLPVILHVRDAFPEIFDVLDTAWTPGMRGVFHSFSGGVDEVAIIKGYGGFLFGINGVVTFKNSGLSSVLPEIGIENLVLETDAPYLSPVPYRGKRNESAYLVEIINKIATSLNISSEEVATITYQNSCNLFSI